MDTKLAVIICSIALGLTSCTPVRSTLITPSPDATVQLAEAASSVSRSMSELAVIERATTPRPAYPLPYVSNYPGMSNLVSVDWSGPIGPLAQRLANAANYRLKVLGNPPAIPAIVTLNAHDSTVGDVLRDAAFQSARKASIYVIPASKIIELRYHAG